MIEMESAATPLGRMAEPDDIANAALFLASDESRDVNGAEPHVDGGAGQI
jgi:NAD(P)-dependent dehydrogenase (short-subunit alcohol dehydrogenase family)